MITITERFLQIGSRKRKGTKINIKGITIHSTGNPNSSADGERRWLDNPANQNEVGWHLVIDEKNCIQAMPLDEFVWHAQSGSHTTFGIEICESGNRQKTVQRAAELTAQLMHQYNLNFNQLYRHEDWYKKGCPGIFKANNWQGWKDFKILVQTYLNAYTKVETTTPIIKPDTIETYKTDQIENLSKIVDFDHKQWLNRIDEPMPTWAVFAFLIKIYHAIKAK